MDKLEIGFILLDFDHELMNVDQVLSGGEIGESLREDLLESMVVLDEESEPLLQHSRPRTETREEGHHFPVHGIQRTSPAHRESRNDSYHFGYNIHWNQKDFTGLGISVEHNTYFTSI